ncbi:putative hydrolase family protein [Rhodopirellula sp. SWK7]|nr:putative hydrolase family protein [Rhodopirellula sp. SWK7]
MYGNVPYKYIENDLKFEDVTPELWNNARAFRKLCYYRVTNADDAIRLLNAGREVRYACEVTSDWYDPPDGVIAPLPENPEFVSSHAVPLAAFDPQTKRFIFPNSWGGDWGNNGWGQFPAESWDAALVSAWDTVCAGLFVPNTFESGVVVRGWKWGIDQSTGVHCIDIYDVDRDEYLAWAFCVVRDGSVDVDEFFVRPEERGKGYARELCRHVLRLVSQIGKPIRLVVGFADTEDYAISGAEAIARLFQVDLVEADVRWASMFGMVNATPRPKRDWKPNRPESIIERLKPRSEPPLLDPRQYTVFFGTNRKPNDSDDFSKGFSNERDYQLHRGHCLVEIPATHKMGSVGRTWVSYFKSAEKNEKRVLTTQSLTAGEMQTFSSSLVNQFERERHNLLFLHGFKNSFEEAALRAAQLGFDLKLPGATYFYSWPARQSLKHYPADEATIETSVGYCLDFVIEILNAFPNVPLHVVAHSMGNRLAVKTFEKLAARENLPGKLGQLVFAAADIDIDLFRLSLPSFIHLPERMTCYTSRGDLAVHLSKRIHDFPRLGAAPPIQCVDGVDTILAEDFPVSEFLGHDYVTEAAPLIHDLFNLIRYNSPPDERPRTRREVDSVSNLPFWSLPVC